MKRPTISILVFLLTFAAFAQQEKNWFPQSELTTVGAYYYPEHWDPAQWERDLKKMSEMGFEFTHFAEFAWAQLEPEEGKYDFTWLDRAVELAAKYNLKVIMCTSTATPPVWLVRKYPEVLSTNENGTKYDHGSRQHATFSSNFYREYSMKMIAELAKHYGTDKRVIGWQLDNEPRKFHDYGEDAHLRFRDWLKNKYKTIDSLNYSWGNAFWSGTYSSFYQINIPKSSQWGMNLHQRLDHNRFSDDETATFLDAQTRTIRKFVSPEQWITTNYIPMYDVTYIGNSRELDFVSYTRYMVYGSDRGTGSKGYRLGDYMRIPLANDYFRSISKTYGVMELQPGQVNWGSVNSQPLPGAVRLWLWQVFSGGSQFACTYRFRAPLYGYEQYHYGIMSYDGVTPTPGGLEYSRFIKEIKTLRKEYNPKAKSPSDYLKRKTGILYNPVNVMSIEQNKQTTEWNSYNHLMKYYKTLKSFSAPVDFLRDDSEFSQYPVLIVPAYQQIDKGLIAKLQDYANKGGNLVLTCRTGHQNRNGHLWEAPFAAPIYDLIGAEIEFYDLLMPHAPDQISFEGANFDWTNWGEILKPRKGTETWATFQGDFYSGKPAIIHRKAGKGTVTYVGVDSKSGQMESKVLSKLYNKLEIPVEQYPEGITVEYRDGFGIAVNFSDKAYEINLPKKADILIGNKSIPTGEVLVWKVK
jgi:beta-galactosidase